MINRREISDVNKVVDEFGLVGRDKACYYYS